MSKERNATQKKKQQKELEHQKQQEKEAQKAKLTRIGLIIAVVLAVVIFVKFRSYIGYYVAVLAIPYGAYGLFVPDKSAKQYAIPGCATAYSRQLGTLIVSLGVLGIFYSRLFPNMQENRLFLVALLLYMVLFYFCLSIINKRYIKKPTNEE